MMRLVCVAALPVSACCSAGCFKRSYGARPVVTFADLGSSRAEDGASDYRLSPGGAKSRRFPTGLAVVRVTVADTACLAEKAGLRFSPLKDVECPAWQECLRDIPEVSEVFFLHLTDFPQKRVSTSDLARMAGVYGARLCLVYAESDLLAGAARVIGVLMDTRSGEIVATMSARHQPRQHGFEVDRPRDRPKGDQRHLDARYQAAVKFRGLVHDCVLELKEGEEEEGGPRLSSRSPR